MDDRLKKQLDFILETDKIKYIERQTYLSDGTRKENDAEHSWHLALMAYLLRSYSNEEIDVLKVMIMVLIHDLVEIDAGDTYAYDAEAHKSKRERELKAADRIFNILPSDQANELYNIWEEFEANETAEAKFAHTLDNLQPIMLNNATNGKAWREHDVAKSQVLKRQENTKLGSETIYDYVLNIIDENVQKKNLKP